MWAKASFPPALMSLEDKNTAHPTSDLAGDALLMIKIFFDGTSRSLWYLDRELRSSPGSGQSGGLPLGSSGYRKPHSWRGYA